MNCAQVNARLWHSGDETRLRVTEQHPPWRIVRGFPNAAGECLVHLNNVSGGVLSGDDLRLTMTLEPGARAQITATGATRVYRRRAGAEGARQHSTFFLESSAVLEYLPDPLIPFAGSRFEQRTQFHLAPDATLFAWDVVAAGRQAARESFAYERLALSTEICSAGAPILIERYAIEPSLRPVDSPARMGPFQTMASFYACRAGSSPGLWRQVEDELARIAGERSDRDGVLWGASALVRDGLVVRGLGRSGRRIAGDLIAFWSAAKKIICGSGDHSAAQDILDPKRRTRCI